MKNKKSISLSLSVLMTAQLIHPSVILANSPESPPNQNQLEERVESDPTEPFVDEVLDPSSSDDSASEIKDPESNETKEQEVDPSIDPGFLIDPDAQPTDPEDPPIDNSSSSTETDTVKPDTDTSVPEEVLEDPLEVPDIKPLETQADEPYLGSVPLSFTNESLDQVLTIHDLSVILASGISLVSYDSNFLEMGIHSRNIAFMIVDMDTAESYDLIGLDHEWILMPGESLNLEIHIKVSCSSQMYQMNNEIVYDYYYEADPTLVSTEIPEVEPIEPIIPDLDIPETEDPAIDPEQPVLMPEIPDETFDEDMMVFPESVTENKEEVSEPVFETPGIDEGNAFHATIEDEVYESDVIGDSLDLIELNSKIVQDPIISSSDLDTNIP